MKLNFIITIMHVLFLLFRFCTIFVFGFLRVCVCVWLVEKRNSGSSNNRGLCYGLCRSGPVGMAAAAAIVSSKKRKRPHSFETNPSIRKRQHNRLLRKLKVRLKLLRLTHVYRIWFKCYSLGYHWWVCYKSWSTSDCLSSYSWKRNHWL